MSHSGFANAETAGKGDACRALCMGCASLGHFHRREPRSRVFVAHPLGRRRGSASGDSVGGVVRVATRYEVGGIAAERRVAGMPDDKRVFRPTLWQPAVCNSERYTVRSFGAR